MWLQMFPKRFLTMVKFFLENFYTCFRKFWVLENSLPIVAKLNKVNTKKKDKNISIFDVTTSYTTNPHKILIKFLSEVINFIFKSITQSCIVFSNTSVSWILKGCGRGYFTRQISVNAISFKITKCYFTIGNLVFEQEIDISLKLTFLRN